jgi:DNA-binding MarR family transcriptional regulator
MHTGDRVRNRADSWAALCGRASPISSTCRFRTPGSRLTDRGWVKRTADPRDGRAVLASLTPVGEDAYERLRAEYRALLHEEMATLDDEEMATLDDEEVRTLASAVQILDRLIDRITRR